MCTLHDSLHVHIIVCKHVYFFCLTKMRSHCIDFSSCHLTLRKKISPIQLIFNHLIIESISFVSNSLCFSKPSYYLSILLFLRLIPRNRISENKVYTILIFIDLSGLFSESSITIHISKLYYHTEFIHPALADPNIKH